MLHTHEMEQDESMNFVLRPQAAPPPTLTLGQVGKEHPQASGFWGARGHRGTVLGHARGLHPTGVLARACLPAH